MTPPTYEQIMAARRIYGVWASMVKRCTNPKSQSYHHYGGRGITVCDRWRKFENFYADMGMPPKVGRRHLTLDRINNDGNYEPKNCRWATFKQQALNRRGVVRLKLNGQIVDVWDVAKRTGLSRWTIYKRVENGRDPITNEAAA